jgi:mannosyltransferase OCH1-like enzyme
MTYPHSIGDIVRIAVLVKHGGIYMDATTIAMDNFDWLLNIGRYPSQYIFNRFGHLPKVFIFMYPHYGSPFDW